MKLMFALAMADLRREWLHLFCNVAMIVGVVLPLLVILGVRNGIADNLLADLSSNPEILKLETQGNDTVTPDDLNSVQAWPEVAFAVLKTRSQSDFLRIRKTGEKVIEDAIAMTTADGDPLLAGVVAPVPGEVAVSTVLASRLELTVGDSIDMVTDAKDRARQLALSARVVAVTPASSLDGRAVLGPVAVMDRIEAFYDGYALPEFGIEAGVDLTERQTQFEGIRVHAVELAAVPALAQRLSETLNRNIRSEAKTIAVTLLLLRNAGRAFGLIATVALAGLSAALAFAFWAQIARKRRVIGTLSLMGLAPRRLALFPVFQAMVTMAAALAISLLFYVAAAAVAELLFSDLSGGRVTTLGWRDLAITVIGGLVLALITVSLAVRRVLALDTATLLRETT